MKRITLLIAFLLSCSLTAHAQQFPRTRTSPAGDLVTIETGSMTAAGSTACLEVSTYAPNVHTLTFSYITQPSGVTVTLYGSNDGCSTLTAIGSSTSTTGDTIQGSGTYKNVITVVSGVTGSIEIRPVYRGLMDLTTVASAVVRSTSAMSGYTTDYTSGATATTVSTTAGTVLTASTVLVQHLRCWNTSAAAATITITDTAGVNIIPPATSVPALTSFTWINDPVGEEWTGIKWSQGTASAILCKVRGKQ